MRKIKTAAEHDDRRVARTCAQLSGAMIQLLLERGWEGISIGELCERANVARSTFYLHYANKQELLESGFASLRKTVRNVAPVTSFATSGKLGFVDGIADHIFENRKTFLAIVGGNGGGIVREQFRLVLSELIAEELAASRQEDRALTQFLSGGFVALAVHVMANKKTTACDFAAQFHHFSVSVLENRGPVL